MTLSDIEKDAPSEDALVAELRESFSEVKRLVSQEVRKTVAQFAALQEVLVTKRVRPASPADTSRPSAEADVIATAEDWPKRLHRSTR